MTRPMVVITTSGIVTRLDWWSTMKVDGRSIVLTPVGDPDPEAVLVVASLSSEAEARALFRTVNDRITLGAGTFDVGDWPPLGRAGQSRQGEC